MLPVQDHPICSHIGYQHLSLSLSVSLSLYSFQLTVDERNMLETGFFGGVQLYVDIELILLVVEVHTRYGSEKQMDPTFALK